MNYSTHASAIFLLTVLAAASCHDQCPTGYQFFENTCVLVAATTGGSTSGGASTQGGGAAADAAAAGTTTGETSQAGAGTATGCGDNSFGRACLSVADCACDTDYCAGYPGQQGVCTHTGCLTDAAICPSQWGCMDLSTIQPGLPSICSPPQ